MPAAVDVAAMNETNGQREKGETKDRSFRMTAPTNRQWNAGVVLVVVLLLVLVIGERFVDAAK